MCRLLKITLLLGIFFNPFLKTQAQTIKECDLALKINSPVNDSIYSASDTVPIFISVKNNGPDAITANDTIHYAFSFVSSYFPPQNIQAGDSIIYGPIASFSVSGLGNGEVDTNEICAHLTNHATSFSDMDTSNNASCATFYFRGAQTGITQNKPLKSFNFKIIPNPAHNKASIILKSKGFSPISIFIYDLAGHLLKQNKFNSPSQNQQINLNLSSISPGIYFIKIQAGMQSEIKKLIIQ